MRFALLADIHAGVSRGDVGKKRLGELVLEPFKKALEQFSDVDYLVIAGDLIDDPKIPPRIFNELLDSIASFPNEVIFVSGNHDIPKIEWKNSLIHALKHLKNVHYYDISRVFERLKANEFPVDELGNLKVLFLPYPNIRKQLYGKIRARFQDYYSKALSDADYDLVIGHLSFEQVSRSNDLSSDFYVPPSNLKAPALMGHLHAFRLAEKYAYPEALVPIPESRRIGREPFEPLPYSFYTVVLEDGKMRQVKIPGVHYVKAIISDGGHVKKAKESLEEALSKVERAFVDIKYRTTVPSHEIERLISRLERNYGERITIRRSAMAVKTMTIEDVLTEYSERLSPVELIRQAIHAWKVTSEPLRLLKRVLFKELKQGLPDDDEELEAMANRIVDELLGE